MDSINIFRYVCKSNCLETPLWWGSIAWDRSQHCINGKFCNFLMDLDLNGSNISNITAFVVKKNKVEYSLCTSNNLEQLQEEKLDCLCT